MEGIEDRIREKAHEIWLEEGMPEGKETEHWFKASDIIRREFFEETVVQPNAAMEAEDFEGVVNPDPAARQSDEPVEQRAAEDVALMKEARAPSARGKAGPKAPGGGRKPPEPRRVRPRPGLSSAPS
jgi:hypothetical protein